MLPGSAVPGLSSSDLAQLVRRWRITPVQPRKLIENLSPGILRLIESNIQRSGYRTFRMKEKLIRGDDLIQNAPTGFMTRFGDMKVPGSRPYKLDIHEVTAVTPYAPIRAASKGQYVRMEIGDVVDGMQTGYWLKNHSYFSEVLDQSCRPCLVLWHWIEDGWGIDTRDVESSRSKWGIGALFVSRSLPRSWFLRKLKTL